MPRNYTIDDSQWSTPPLTLSAGWNMLRLGGSNEYIDEQSTSLMTPLLPNFWNQSVSRTTTADASTTLNFIGTDIWAYGMAGPEQGAYKAVLDGKEIGKYTANTPKANYNSLLFAAHELQDGIVHRLQLVNDQAGASLAFDMALITTSTEDISLPPIVPSQTSATASTASAAPGSSILPADDTGSLFNHTSGGLEGIAQAAGVPPNLIPTQYTKEQLSLLHTKYEFHWNGAAYFVVVFSCIVSALFVALVIRMIAQSLSERKKRARRARDGESYLITGKRPRPTTRIVEALKGKKISNPMPSENGHSVRTGTRTGTDRRDSEGTGATYIDNDVAKGW